ncbi:MAG: cyclic nucleotide-binding domain-containing protein [Bacteroidia bacterium]|nr:cyclic nucleotide-binding domain-containing protein [Bacteroidia bacterium]
MEFSKIKENLQLSSLFSKLTEEELERVAQRAKFRQFFAGDVIVWQGQPSTTLFIVVNGIVAVKQVSSDRERLLAYLMPGTTFGEVGILENAPRSATVDALSEVDVLVIQRKDFLDIMNSHPSVAIELARILGRYLVDSNRRHSKAFKESKLILVFHPEDKNNGSTSFSALLAEEMAHTLHTPTALFEYPNPWRILRGYDLGKGSSVYHHHEGYDILFPTGERYLPVNTRVTLMLDNIRSNYDNIVIHVRNHVDEGVGIMVEQADQIVVMVSPTDKGIKNGERIMKQLKGKIKPNETSVITISNHGRPEFKELEPIAWADYTLPFEEAFPRFQLPNRVVEEVPESFSSLLSNCIERLERTNSIGIFIPTTLDADQEADTSKYMDQAMNFMAERFGGATCKTANGVWHSEKLGLIGEVVYIVHSYITQADMNSHLDEVVDYIKILKKELRQEAMALEVNQKLTLI